MSLLSAHSLQRARAVLPVELFSYSFHTSTTLQAASKNGSNSRGTSRTRLAKDIAPRKKSFGLAKPASPADTPRKSARKDDAPQKSAMRDDAPQRPATHDDPGRRSTTKSGSGRLSSSFTRDAVPHAEAKDIFGAIEKSREWRKERARRLELSELARNSRKSSQELGRKDSALTEKVHKPWMTERTSRYPATEAKADLPPALRLPGDGPNRIPRPKPVSPAPVEDEFNRTSPRASPDDLSVGFTSPPLMEGLLSSVKDILGRDASPTPIQALSLKHLFSQPERQWRQYLLASETGSGKSLAYLLPMLNDLKSIELSSGERIPEGTPPDGKSRPYNPRCIVLAPTHELSRQLSKMAKALLHNIKMRVICASDPNKQLKMGLAKVSAAKMAAQLAAMESDMDGSVQIQDNLRSIDVLVGTPAKILEMARGHGWNWAPVREGPKDGYRPFIVGDSEVGLHRVEWVVVDEADVLFDPDFVEETQLLLADIAAARGQPVPVENPAELNYPFNLVLTSATIPNSLASYLDKHHPKLNRLASPNLHKLPSTLKTEHAEWTGGNRVADIEQRIRRIWWYDGLKNKKAQSKVLIFCNKSTAVENLGKELAEKGIPNIALTSTAEARKKGNNHHLNGFLLAPLQPKPSEVVASSKSTSASTTEGTDNKSTPAVKSEEEPNVLITTSLLSRGLDFAPEIKHVLITDQPRNMVDFLHRAGRTGRAGQDGTVVVFGKSKGRGSEKHREMKSRVRALKF